LISRFKDHCKAQEVLQITLIKAWKNIKKYEGKSKFVSWLNRIAHNTYYDHVRKLKRESSLDEMKERAAAHGQGGVDNGYVDNYLGLTDDDPHRPIKLKELNNKLAKVISMLSKDHEQVIKMKEIEDLSCKEISLKINCPYPTVCTRLFYARKKAKEILTRLSNE
jgi:RNA polymerase sigma-70 factor (ECF subfamily)